MFCNNCGKPNQDGAKFCSECGAPINQIINQQYDNSQQKRQQARNSEITELDKMIRYFSQKSMVYEEYDRISAELSRFSKGKHYALLIWGIIVSFLGTIFVSAFSREEPAKLALGFIPFLLGQGMIVGHIVYAVSFSKRKKELEAKLSEISSELFEYYKAYGTCVVGAEYTNPSNLIAIANTIRSGRADTIKEAINVLLDDVYRNNMQNLTAQSARSAAAAARGATAGAVFSAANFFTRR